MIRAVLDANVLVSALIRPQGPPGRIVLRLLKDRAFELVVSPSTLDELSRSLGYPRVRRYLRSTQQEIDTWIESLAIVADVVEGGLRPHVVTEDPDDDIYIGAAIEGMAHYIVSGDRHLLDVAEIEGIQIVTPREFIRILG